MSGGSHWQRSSEELLRALALREERIRREYAESLELIAELATRDTAVEVGYPNLPALLRDVLRITPSEARRRLSLASAVTETPLVSGGVAPASLPVTAAALQEGVLGADHVEVIARALGDLPMHIRDADRETAERTLVEAAHSMDARTLTKVGHRVRAWLDEDGTPPADREPAEPVNELHLHTRQDGRLVLRGDFDPEASALITTMLSPLAKPRPSSATGPDPRSAAERNGDALVELVHLAAAAGDLPSEAGEKPHLLVTVPLHVLRTDIATVTGPERAALAGIGQAILDGTGQTVLNDLVHATFNSADQADSGMGHTRARQAIGSRTHDHARRAVLDGVGPIDAASVRRIACDAKVIPVVLGSRSEPLDLGRATYTVSTALRRALILRDGGCAFPGCDRSHRWCHSHHIRHWADGGSTEPDNLVLLCGRHHRLIHHSPWTCTIRHGRPEFRPPGFVDPTRTPRHNALHSVTGL